MAGRRCGGSCAHRLWSFPTTHLRSTHPPTTPTNTARPRRARLARGARRRGAGAAVPSPAPRTRPAAGRGWPRRHARPSSTRRPRVLAVTQPLACVTGRPVCCPAALARPPPSSFSPAQGQLAATLPPPAVARLTPGHPALRPRSPPRPSRAETHTRPPNTTITGLPFHGARPRLRPRRASSPSPPPPRGTSSASATGKDGAPLVTRPPGRAFSPGWAPAAAPTRHGHGRCFLPLVRPDAPPSAPHGAASPRLLADTPPPRPRPTAAGVADRGGGCARPGWGRRPATPRGGGTSTFADGPVVSRVNGHALPGRGRAPCTQRLRHGATRGCATAVATPLPRGRGRGQRRLPRCRCRPRARVSHAPLPTLRATGARSARGHGHAQRVCRVVAWPAGRPSRCAIVGTSSSSLAAAAASASSSSSS